MAPRRRVTKKLNEKRIHPTQKPVALYRWIFRKPLKPQWKVCDPFLGSGSSRIAASEFEIDFVGFELDAYLFCGARETIPARSKLERRNRNEKQTDDCSRCGLRGGSWREQYRRAGAGLPGARYTGVPFVFCGVMLFGLTEMLLGRVHEVKQPSNHGKV